MHEFALDPWFVEKARLVRDGRLNAYEAIDPATSALVIVDMQNYYMMDGMPACAPIAREIVPNVNRLAKAARERGVAVIWIKTEALPDQPDDWANRKEATSTAGWKDRQALLSRSGEGYRLFATCDVQSSDIVVHKTRYSAFIPYPSQFEGTLQARGIDTLLITGVSTSTCCESTARDASMLGYRTIMISDATADETDVLHNHTLGKFLVTFGDVQSTDDIIAKLTNAGLAAAE
jgi:ureidoacrylate peracid hydrolase